jgi:hypothetical protein
MLLPFLIKLEYKNIQVKTAIIIKTMKNILVYYYCRSEHLLGFFATPIPGVITHVELLSNGLFILQYLNY